MHTHKGTAPDVIFKNTALIFFHFAHLSPHCCCFKTLRKHSGCCQLLLKVFIEQKHA